MAVWNHCTRDANGVGAVIMVFAGDMRFLGAISGNRVMGENEGKDRAGRGERRKERDKEESEGRRERRN